MLSQLLNCAANILAGSLPRREDSWSEKGATLDSSSWDEELRQAATGRGQWINNADMPAWANIYGRLYRTEDGTIHRCLSLPMIGEPQVWFYPEQLERMAGELR